MLLKPSGGAGGGVLNNYGATADPTTSNDETEGYTNGSQWLNTTTGHLFVLIDASNGNWDRISPPYWYDLMGVNGGLIYDNAGDTVERMP